MKHLLRTALFALLLAWIAQAAVAQNFPAKPVHFVVPYAAGGAFDIMTRTLAEPLSERWGKPVLVDNRPGAGAIIGTEIVARSPADGYALLVTGVPLLINPILRPKLSYDAFKDFAPITLVAKSPIVLVVNASSVVKSLPELLDQARARPGQLSYASVGPGGTFHVVGEMLKLEAKLDLVYAPFAGGAPAVTALLGNHVAFAMANYSEVAQHLAAGKLRALAVASPERFDLLPEVPTLSESGFKDAQFSVWVGIVAPAGTPRDVIEKIQADLAYVLKLPNIRAKLAAQGLYSIGSTPDEFGAHMRAESAKFERVIKAAGIKID